MSTWTAIPLSAALGGATALAFAPWHWTIMVAVGLSALLGLVDQARTWRRALLLGWLFGFGHFLVGLHWIVESFQVDSQRTGPLAMPALLALSAYLASFPALACLATKVLASRGPSRLLVFAAAWSASEWLRGTLATGFPWNVVGYVWMPYVAPVQAASFVGVYGLGFVTVVLAALPRLMISSPARRSAWPVAGLVLGMAMLWGLGQLRLASAIDGDVPGVRLRLVQASVPQHEKWDPAMRDGIIERYRALSILPAIAAPPTHIIWPESALPFVVADTSQDLRDISEGVVPPGGVLLTGADHRSGSIEQPPILHNSLIAVDAEGSVVGRYDKVRLVPFGEYVPLRGMLSLQKIAAGTIDFAAGTMRGRLAIAGLPVFAPLICYEAIFPVQPGEVADAQWLLNITNDAWFGASAGPYQHFAGARMRAIEAGVPLVRNANTGISAVIDAYGRVRASLALNEAGILDANLPLSIPGRTVYARWGDLPLGITAVGVLVWAGFARTRRWITSGG